MSNRTIEVTERVWEYLVRETVREPDALARLRQETLSLPNAQMQIAPEQGRFMALLVELLGARRTLEIGVYTGYSALSVALVLPPDGRLIACDVSEDWTKIARRYWLEAGVAEKIDLRLATALTTLDQLLAEGQAEAFDFAFIDADKGNYLAYYERCLSLVRAGGLIAADNALWSGAVADPTRNDDNTRAIREFNATVTNDPRVTTSLVPIGDGLLLARKR
jgi:predicted O-methyltransferase YrrM